MRRQEQHGKGDIKKRLKKVENEHIYTARYGFVGKGLTQFLCIMKMVDPKDYRASEKLAKSNKLASIVGISDFTCETRVKVLSCCVKILVSKEMRCYKT